MDVARRGDGPASRDGLELGQVHVLHLAERKLKEPLAKRAEEERVAGGEKAVPPSRRASFSIPFRASVSPTSRAVSSAEKTMRRRG